MATRKDLLTIASSKTAARKLARELSIEQLRQALDNLEAAYDFLKERDASLRAAAREKTLKRVKSVIDQAGLSSEELSAIFAEAPTNKTVSATGNKKRGVRRRKKIPPKYEIKTGTETCKWTGRGRMPLRFKEFIEQGGSLEKCLIK